MNYLKQITQFYKLLPNNPLSASAQCLYFYLLNKNNELAWIKEFTVANMIVCGYTGLNRQALDRARNELKQKGYIDYKKGVSNQAGKYLIVEFVTQDVTQNVTHNVTQDDTQGVTQSDTQDGHTVSTLNKLNKTKQITPKSPVDFDEGEKNFSVFNNWDKNLQCDCTSKSTNSKCLRRSTYSINGVNYCNQHSREVLSKIFNEISKENKKPWVSCLELPDDY